MCARRVQDVCVRACVCVVPLSTTLLLGVRLGSLYFLHVSFEFGGETVDVVLVVIKKLVV